jgi:hypothetical protein
MRLDRLKDQAAKDNQFIILCPEMLRKLATELFAVSSVHRVPVLQIQEQNRTVATKTSVDIYSERNSNTEKPTFLNLRDKFCVVPFTCSFPL